MSFLTPQQRLEGVRALFAPRNIAIVGASDRPGNWSGRVYRSLKRFNFPGKVFPVNPRNATVWDGETCYPSLRDLPEAPDHVVVIVPGAAAIGAIAEAGAAKARSATVFSGGFGEGGDPKGRALGAELRQAIEQAGIAVSGPNCMGNLSASHRLMTIPDDRITELERGPVAVIGQSGGIVMAIHRALLARGVNTGYAVTSGNEIGLYMSDYIRYLAEDPDIRAIACFIESIKDADEFRTACAAARDAGKPVVAVKIGGSEESRKAALAHTGSLAGSLDCFDAVAETIGVVRVDTLDEMVETVEYFTHASPPKGPRLGALSFSGGLKGLMLEAAQRNGLSFPALLPETNAKVSEVLGVGTSLGNPLDAGFAALSSSEAYFRCIEVLLADPNFDVLLLQEELPPAPRINNKVENLKTVDAMVAKGTPKPIAVVSMISYMFTDYTKEFRTALPHLPVLQEVDKALRAVGRAGRYGELCGLAKDAGAPAAGGARPDVERDPGATTARRRRTFRAERSGFQGSAPRLWHPGSARNRGARRGRGGAGGERDPLSSGAETPRRRYHAQVRHRRRDPRNQRATPTCAPPMLGLGKIWPRPGRAPCSIRSWWRSKSPAASNSSSACSAIRRSARC